MDKPEISSVPEGWVANVFPDVNGQWKIIAFRLRRSAYHFGRLTAEQVEQFNIIKEVRNSQ